MTCSGVLATECRGVVRHMRIAGVTRWLCAACVAYATGIGLEPKPCVDGCGLRGAERRRFRGLAA